MTKREEVAKKISGKEHYNRVMEKARGVSHQDKARGVRWQNKTPQSEKFFKTIKKNFIKAGKNQENYTRMRSEGLIKDPK